MVRESVKPGKKVRLERWVEAGGRLAWSFFINGEMTFRVLRVDGTPKLAYLKTLLKPFFMV